MTDDKRMREIAGEIILNANNGPMAHRMIIDALFSERNRAIRECAEIVRLADVDSADLLWVYEKILSLLQEPEKERK